VIGGAHLLPAKDDAISEVAASLHDRRKVAWIAPVHCTGEPAFAILSKTFGSPYRYAGLGTTLMIGRQVKAVDAMGCALKQLMDEIELQGYRVLLEQQLPEFESEHLWYLQHLHPDGLQFGMAL
jgi:7,8-dihydropterin-6-yl-methyl-4-(beta-D-ribofuranosyl)aminobenzene 5'-phosphate synthase